MLNFKKEMEENKLKKKLEDFKENLVASFPQD